jgi:hypothetical protein
MKNLKITDEAHKLLKQYCDENYLKISEWISNEIMELIENMKDGKSDTRNKK